MPIPPEDGKKLADPWSDTGGGFTLLEILCALVVVAILATLIVPVVGSYRARAQGLQCVNNLKGLGAASLAYMNDHENRWPQVALADSGGEASVSGQREDVTAVRWIETLAAYGVGEKTWRCPTIEGRMQSNGKAEAVERKRIDYVPTRFDAEPGSAIQWPNHPWFIERTPSHGLGPKLLLADGRVVAMEDLLKELPESR
jgi:prepilin-type N-terminal cleavage/methylation domain-containing protein